LAIIDAVARCFVLVRVGLLQRHAIDDLSMIYKMVNNAKEFGLIKLTSYMLSESDM